ncbi:hypothetical protein OG410_21435 [Streptomyces sp. NBC_00659]|uniref:hypothetical protein n=1 Tax=Streptomyces sp. NBC_00659 TaxID=2903669 RepID=UPI002E3080F6|nr:hypothetical protein [Streptomyces sp. NBC_00659]
MLAATAAAAALCVSLAPTGRAAAVPWTADARTTAKGASTAADGTSGPYAFAEDAIAVKGAAGTTDSVLLRPGRTYKSSVGLAGRDGRLYYRLELGAGSDAYVSATAVPRPGATVSYSDGLKVSLQDANGRNCSFTGSAHFGATQSPHPIAAWASRETSGEQYACQTAGTYYVVVERTGAAGATSGTEAPAGTESSASRTWDLELGYVSEPALKTASGPTSAPEVWNSASPEPLVGDAKHRGGGAGFSGAVPLGQGVWKDGISPGQTRFYKVPVDWGQQVYATADLGSASRGEGSVGTALVMSLYNPVRGLVDGVGSGYDGSQRSAALAPLPPVAYENRFALNDRVSGMRFAGSYYLVVHLAAQVADRFGEGPFGLTLRVRVAGAAGTGPAYAGKPVPKDVFTVPVGGSDDAAGDGTADGAAGTGESGGGTGRGGVMKLVAAGGIGTGTLLMLTLGMWTVIARRRAVRTVRPAPAPEDADTASASLPAPAPWEHGAARGR